MKVTKEQINAWKKKHGRVFSLTFADKKVYVHKPNRQQVKYMMGCIANQDLFGATEFLLENCYIGGDKVGDDTGYVLGVMSQVDGLIETKLCELEEL